MHKNYIFSKMKIFFRNISVPTLPKIFRSVTRNTLIFLFDLTYNFTILFAYFQYKEVVDLNVFLRLSMYVLTTAESRVKVCPVKLAQWEYV